MFATPKQRGRKARRCIVGKLRLVLRERLRRTRRIAYLANLQMSDYSSIGTTVACFFDAIGPGVRSSNHKFSEVLLCLRQLIVWLS